MAQTAAQITERVFARAREDPTAAPLADAFEAAYQQGTWTADSLHAQVRALSARASIAAEDET
jgi:hypothetical protein